VRDVRQHPGAHAVARVIAVEVLGEAPDGRSGGRRRVGGAGRAGQRAAEALLQQREQRRVLVEEDLLLVGEVAEERALGDAGGSGDLPDRRPVVAVLGEEPERGVAQPLPGPLLPARHGGRVGGCVSH
jgi:hypothetical protein